MVIGAEGRTGPGGSAWGDGFCRSGAVGVRQVELALVGPFLLYSGPLEKYVSQTATVIVGSLDPVLEALSKAGAEVLEAPNEVPNATRIVARHPDGSVFEYMQPRT
jgi:hypothetical protein